MREYRGTLTHAGKLSPYRERSVDDNLDLFQRMRAGEFVEELRIGIAELVARIEGDDHSGQGLRRSTARGYGAPQRQCTQG